MSPTAALPALAGKADAPAAGSDDLLGDFYAAGFTVSRTDCWLAAIAFYRREGHLRVPTRHRERGINLYRHITQIRAKRRTRKLTKAQIAVWDSIGMHWPRSRPDGRVLNPRQRAEIVRRYTEQKPQPSLRALAAEYGCSYGTVHRVVEEARDRVQGESLPQSTFGQTPVGAA